MSSNISSSPLAAVVSMRMFKNFSSDLAPKLLRALLLAGVTIVAGCTTPTVAPEGSPKQASQSPFLTNQGTTATIRTVYLDPNVELPSTPFVQTRADTWAEGLGGLAAIARAFDESEEQATAHYLGKHDIQIGNMLRDAFSAELESRDKLLLAKSMTDADAVIRLVVLKYGIEHTFNPLSSDYRTLLKAKAIVVRPRYKTEWIKEIPAESDEQSLATLKQLYGDPEVMRKHMDLVAKMGAKQLVDHLLSAAP